MHTPPAYLELMRDLGVLRSRAEPCRDVNLLLRPTWSVFLFGLVREIRGRMSGPPRAANSLIPTPRPRRGLSFLCMPHATCIEVRILVNLSNNCHVTNGRIRELLDAFLPDLPPVSGTDFVWTVVHSQIGRHPAGLASAKLCGI